MSDPERAVDAAERISAVVDMHDNAVTVCGCSWPAICPHVPAPSLQVASVDKA